MACLTLKKLILKRLTLEKLTLKGLTNLEGANLEEAKLEGARNLSLDQLSRVKTLYDTKLDEQLLRSLKEKHPALFEVP